MSEVAKKVRRFLVWEYEHEDTVGRIFCEEVDANVFNSQTSRVYIVSNYEEEIRMRVDICSHYPEIQSSEFQKLGEAILNRQTITVRTDLRR